MDTDGQQSPEEQPGAGATGATIELAPGVLAPLSAIELSTACASGPGGQNVNKRQTKVILRVTLDALPLRDIHRRRLQRLAGSSITGGGELIIASDVHKSQSRNREECYQRLRDLLLEATRPLKIRKPTRTPAWVKRKRLEDKRKRGDTKKRRQNPDA